MILVFGGTGSIGSFVSSHLSYIDDVVLAVKRPVKSEFGQILFRKPGRY